MPQKDQTRAGSSILMLLLAIEPNVLRIPTSFTTEDELMSIAPRYVLRLPSGCHPHPRPPPQARTEPSSGGPSRKMLQQDAFEVVCAQSQISLKGLR
jgi:hypothetical protein